MIEIIDKLGTQVGSYQNQSNWYAEGINRIKANAAAEGRALTDEEQRKIWEYEDALLDINNSLMDMVETVENSENEKMIYSHFVKKLTLLQQSYQHFS